MPPLTSKHIVGGEVRRIVDAADILRDTFKGRPNIFVTVKPYLKAMYRQTLHGIFEFAEPKPPNLTVEMICHLHSQLMRTSRVYTLTSVPDKRYPILM